MVFTWVCLSLVISNITYKDWVKLLVFALGSYLGMAAFLYSGQLSLYADIVLGIMPAAILISFYLSKNELTKDIIWLTPAMFMLAQVKSGSGMLFGIFVLIIMLIISIRRKTDKRKLLLLLHPLSSLMISAVLAGRFTDEYIGSGLGRTSNLGELFLSTPLTYIALGLTLLTVAVFIYYICRRSAKKVHIKPVVDYSIMSKYLYVDSRISHCGVYEAGNGRTAGDKDIHHIIRQAYGCISANVLCDNSDISLHCNSNSFKR